MIMFKTIKWKNFLSTGNKFTEIQLDRSPTTLIVGKNGAGKSTMLDALSFGLFGKPHRSINKKQLVNSINGKGCVVEVEFSIGKHEFKLHRSIKPNTLEIWQNGNMINQNAEVKDYQKYLEQNILKLNHKSFHQIVVLGSSSFIPFMQLSTSARREVIEDLLDINIFTKMNQILKERVASIKERLKDTEYTLNITKERITLQQKYVKNITDLNEVNIRQKQNRISDINNSIKEYTSKNEELTAYIEDNSTTAEEKLKSTNSKRNKMVEYSGQFKQKMSAIAQEAKFFETNENCPTCEQSIDADFKEKKVASAKDKAKELSVVMDRAKTELDSVTKQFEEYEALGQTIRSYSAEVSNNNRAITNLNNEINDIEKEIKALTDTSGDLSEAQTQLSLLIDEREALTENKLNIMDDANYACIGQELLKDTGIKTKIIKEYLPVMNKLINSYLQTMDFFVSFHLDESFNETIRSRYRDNFNYASFSEGEKMKINLALLFSWRQIAKMKNSASTNLLIMDEIMDSSLDEDSLETFMKILKSSTSEGTRAFIISHRGDQLEDKFRNKIVFEKVGNFSAIEGI